MSEAGRRGDLVVYRVQASPSPQQNYSLLNVSCVPDEPLRSKYSSPFILSLNKDRKEVGVSCLLSLSKCSGWLCLFTQNHVSKDLHFVFETRNTLSSTCKHINYDYVQNKVVFMQWNIILNQVNQIKCAELYIIYTVISSHTTKVNSWYLVP